MHRSVTIEMTRATRELERIAAKAIGPKIENSTNSPLELTCTRLAPRRWPPFKIAFINRLASTSRLSASSTNKVECSWWTSRAIAAAVMLSVRYPRAVSCSQMSSKVVLPQPLTGDVTIKRGETM
jgi:hypothetical protein